VKPRIVVVRFVKYTLVEVGVGVVVPAAVIVGEGGFRRSYAGRVPWQVKKWAKKKKDRFEIGEKKKKKKEKYVCAYVEEKSPDTSKKTPARRNNRSFLAEAEVENENCI
jgi:hypothetical protein